MPKARKQATPAQIALANAGIGKITRGGAYRSPAKMASDQARNLRRSFARAEASFREAAASSPEFSAARRRYAAHAEHMKAQVKALYSTRERVPGRKMTSKELAAAQRLNREAASRLAKTPTSSRDVANRAKMAELEWGAFNKHLSIASYSQTGQGGWTSGESLGMGKGARRDMVLHRFITAARNKGYNMDLDYDANGELTSESKAQVMEIYRKIYEEETGAEPEFFSEADAFVDPEGSPPGVGALSNFYA